MTNCQLESRCAQNQIRTGDKEGQKVDRRVTKGGQRGTLSGMLSGFFSVGYMLVPRLKRDEKEVLGYRALGAHG